MSTSSFHFEDFIQRLTSEIPEDRFHTYIEPLEFIDLNEKELTLYAPNEYLAGLVELLYAKTLKDALKRTYGLGVQLKLVTDRKYTSTQATHNAAQNIQLDSIQQSLTMASSVTKNQQTNMLPSNDFSPSDWIENFNDLEEHYENEDRISQPSLSPSSSSTSSANEVGFVQSRAVPSQNGYALNVQDLTRAPIPTLGYSLNPNYTFQSYIVGPSNQFAHAAARAVAENPGRMYNPLFLYSDAGLGKTHLLHSIGNHVLKINPRARICYLSAENFVNDLVLALRSGTQADFRKKYRSGYDVLLMDDIQFLAGKRTSEEEFFHTFNTLHSSEKQIVVASDKFPKDIPGLEDRIRSRFEWGLIVEVQIPDIETRLAILKSKAQEKDIFLPNDVALFLASNIKSNVRELEGALHVLGARAKLSGAEISIELAKQSLKSLLKQPSETLDAHVVLETVAKYFTLKVADLKSKDKRRKVALPRQISMYLMRKFCNKSFAEIGLQLGGKDHSTVVHGVKSVAEAIESDASLKSQVESIQNLL